MGQNKSKEKLTNQVKKVLNDWWHQVQAKPILYALIFFFVMSIVSLDNILGTLQQTNINFTGAIWFGSLLLLSWLVLLRTAKQPRPVQVMTAGAVSLLIFFCIAESIRFLIRHQALSAKIWETGTFWTLAALLISSPVAFVVWRFRDENQSKDINLKEFQKISEWVTGAHFQEEKHSEKFSGSLPENADAAQPSERSREYYRPAASAQALHTFSKQDGAVGLQIAAVYNLLPFYHGDYGQAFEKPSVHLLHSAWQVLQHDILQELDKADDDKTRDALIQKLHQRANSPLGQAITRVLLACDHNKKPLLHRHLEILRGICLSGMNFELAGLETKILRDTLFCGQDLTGAQWQGVRGMQGWNLSGAQLHKANLLGIRLYRANLFGAGLFRVNLSDAILIEANLSKAWLRGADFSRALLNRANLANARLDWSLSEANFSRTALYGVNLCGIKFDEKDYIDIQVYEREEFYGLYDLADIFLNKILVETKTLLRGDVIGGSLVDEDSFSQYEPSEQEQLKEKGLIVLYKGEVNIPTNKHLVCRQETAEKLESKYPTDFISFPIDLKKTQENNPDWKISIE